MIASRSTCLVRSSVAVSPRPCSSRRVGLSKPRNLVAVSYRVSSSENASAVEQKARRSLRMPTIQLISSAVAVQAQTQRFERFAGRSAMIGVIVAVVAELLTDSSIFSHFSPDTVAFLSSLFMGAVSLAAAAAFASKRRMGLELLEAVMTSLTANQRSAASVTGQQVDIAVDSILNKAFDQGVIYSILAEDEDI